MGELVEKAVALNKALTEFKLSGFADIEAFVDLSVDKYNVALGGKKGNVTLYTYDGKYKIQRAMQDRIGFDERLQAAKALIDACLAEWTEGARPEVHALINRAFSTDKEGEINTGAVLDSAPVQVYSDTQASGYFGRGSQAHLMVREALTANSNLQLFVLPQVQYADSGWIVFCNKCKIKTGAFCYIGEAIAAWNRRENEHKTDC